VKKNRKSSQKQFWITLKFEGNVERIVQVRASNREVAENRALKRNPAATGVKKDG
jgi:hypothetical protein